MNLTNERKPPFFSVIIPTYNRLTTIKEAIDSLITQSEKSWECIIVDDGSSDGTFNYLVNNYTANSNFKIIYHENQGLGFSRNSGIRLSSGDYITFLDSDDKYLEGHLESRRKILENEPEIEILHGGVEIAGDRLVPDKFNPGKLISLDECVVGGTFLIKRNVFKKIGFFPTIRFGDDAEFFLKAEKSGIRIKKTNIRTYYYNRQMPDSLCNTAANQQFFQL